MKTGEAAQILGLSQNTVRLAIRRGNLPGIRVGTHYLVERDGIDRLLTQARSHDGQLGGSQGPEHEERKGRMP